MIDRIAQLTKLLSVEPDDAFCLYGLAQEYAKQGNFAQAIAFYDRALAADPNLSYAYFHKAKCQENVGDAPGAKETLEQGLEQALTCGDAKAAGEIRGYLDEIS